MLANHLICHNTGRKDVLCHSHASTPGTEITLHRSESDADAVLQILQGQPEPALAGTAILFRVWSQSVPIELKLLARQIPYRIDAGKGALFSREVQAITALLMVVTGKLENLPDEDRLELARQLLRFPHVGLKEPELEQLARFLAGFSSGWHERLLAASWRRAAAIYSPFRSTTRIPSSSAASHPTLAHDSSTPLTVAWSRHRPCGSTSAMHVRRC